MSQEASGLKEDRKKVLKRAFFMASGTLTSRILGLLRDMALGALFDRRVTDAWTAAFRVPNLFRRLLGEGSLSVSFIPVFIEARAEEATGVRARNLVNGLYTLLLIVLGVLTLLGIFYTDEVFRLLLSDHFGSLAEKWELTVRLGRIMFGFVFFVCLYAYYMGILNALGSFGLPAAAPALLNISMLVFTFIPDTWFPGRGDGLAWGVFVGGALQASLLWWALRRRDYLPVLQWSLWSQDVRHVLRNMGPGFVGMGLTQFSTLVNLYFASSLREGSISYIYWADRLLELPLSLISVSLGSALLPTLSELVTRKETLKFQETAQESFLVNLFWAWPSALGLFFLAEPLVKVLFLRGHFTIEDAQSTAGVLQIYAVSLILISVSRVLMPLYYAIKNTWFPATVSAVCLVLHILLAPFFMSHYGLRGLVLSGAIATLLNAILLGAGLSWWNLQFQWSRVGKSVLKFLVAGVSLVLPVLIFLKLEPEMQRGLLIPVLFVVILISASSYFLTALVLKCEEAIKIRQWFRP